MKNKTSSLHTYIDKMWYDQIIVHNTLENLLKEVKLDEYLRQRLDYRYIMMAACAFGNEVYRSDANLTDKIEAAKYIIKDEKLKEVMERVKNYNLDNIKNLGNKEEK
jgi:hypothetical protein